MSAAPPDGGNGPAEAGGGGGGDSLMLGDLDSFDDLAGGYHQVCCLCVRVCVCVPVCCIIAGLIDPERTTHAHPQPADDVPSWLLVNADNINAGIDGVNDLLGT